MCEKREVDERSLSRSPTQDVAAPPSRPLRPHFEALLEQIAEVRFDTHVRQHPAENDFADTALAQLQDEIVGLWTKHLWGLTTIVLPSSM